MYVIGVDPADVNVGISILKDYEIIYIDRFECKLPLPKMILDIIKENKLSKYDIVVIFESQYPSSHLKTMVDHARGYLDAHKVINLVRKPPSYGKNIKSYTERKQFSIRICFEKIRMGVLTCSDEIYNKLKSDERIHDITDSINMAYTFRSRHP